MPAPVIFGLTLPVIAAWILRVVILPIFLYYLFYWVIQLAGYLVFSSDAVQNAIGTITPYVFTWGEAMSLLPAYATQLFFFMHLDQSITRSSQNST